MDHVSIADKYILPLSNFLVSMYGISPLDAYGISWRGGNATQAYERVETFAIQGIRYLKTDIEQSGANYSLGLKGQSKCD
jgi:hypothetical protein